MGNIFSDIFKTFSEGFGLGWVVGIGCAIERGWVLRFAWRNLCAFFWYVLGRRRAEDYAQAYQ